MSYLLDVIYHNKQCNNTHLEPDLHKRVIPVGAHSCTTVSHLLTYQQFFLLITHIETKKIFSTNWLTSLFPFCLIQLLFTKAPTRVCAQINKNYLWDRKRRGNFCGKNSESFEVVIFDVEPCRLFLSQLCLLFLFNGYYYNHYFQFRLDVNNWYIKK